MDSLQSAIVLMTPNCFMASIDLKDAYYSVPVAQEFQRFLKFKWRDKAYQFICLPNGLSPAPRIFTKIMKPVYSFLRKMGHLNSGYIDDIYLQGQDLEECKNNVRDTVTTLERSGFTIHPVKYMLAPKQELVHLGFILNSRKMTVRVTPDKAAKIERTCRQVLAAGVLTIRELAELVGQLVASFPGVLYGQLFYRSLDNHKTMALKLARGNFETKTLLPQDCWDDLDWWITNIASTSCPILRGPPDVTICTDASNTGWGGVAGDKETGGR